MRRFQLFDLGHYFRIVLCYLLQNGHDLKEQLTELLAVSLRCLQLIVLNLVQHVHQFLILLSQLANSLTLASFFYSRFGLQLLRHE